MKTIIFQENLYISFTVSDLNCIIGSITSEKVL